MSVDVVNKLVRVTVAYQYPDAQIEENNLGYICTVAGAGDSRAALGAAVQALFVANYNTFIPSVAGFYGNRTQTLMPQPIDSSVSVINTIAGAALSGPIPTQVRPVLTFKTALGGRQGRGRLFLPTPGTAAAAIATGFPTAALNTAVNALGTALLAAIAVGGSTWRLSLVHRVPGVPPLPSTYTSTIITTAEASQRFGTQRKSGDYGRVNVNPW